jgi:hypothetical protein
MRPLPSPHRQGGQQAGPATCPQVLFDYLHVEDLLGSCPQKPAYTVTARRSVGGDGGPGGYQTG